MVQNRPPYLFIKKNSGGQQEEVHGVVHHLQQEHHQSTWCTIFKMPGDDTEILGANNPTHHTQPPKPNQPLVNQLEVLEPSLGLDLIDSQSSLIHQSIIRARALVQSWYLQNMYSYAELLQSMDQLQCKKIRADFSPVYFTWKSNRLTLPIQHSNVQLLTHMRF